MKTAVYVMDKSYYILWTTERESLGWVRIGDREYHEEVSGILLSGTVHRIKVPCRELDKYGEYTVCTAVMKKRGSYFSETETAEEETIKFKPVCGGRPVNIYMVADTHSVIDTPVEAGGYFGDKLDLVIMNGDIMDTSEDISSW